MFKSGLEANHFAFARGRVLTPFNTPLGIQKIEAVPNIE